ncbi:hypothetical protein [Hyphococcus sp.]|jgi:hypothetical protein|uniref:hypothetical protein n=1 Tax=Hyphococcus sp. TaxID=2038636 RepID=UPI003D0B33DA
MCVAPDSQFFWIGLGLLVSVGLLCLYTLRQFVRQVAKAKTPEAWVEALHDHGAPLTINGLWFLVITIAAKACGF